MTAHTPIYGLEYITEGEPLRNTRAALENNAHTIEAALQAGGVAATGASDLLAVSGRVSTLETKMTAVEGAGWVDFPLVGAPYMVSYQVGAIGSGVPGPVKVQMRLKNGRVELRGWGRSDTTTATGGVYTLAPGHLPAAYRPPATVTLFVPRDTGAVHRFQVEPNGCLYNFQAISATAGSPWYFCFDGISWGLS
jgi:hypothetical protein